MLHCRLLLCCSLTPIANALSGVAHKPSRNASKVVFRRDDSSAQKAVIDAGGHYNHKALSTQLSVVHGSDAWMSRKPKVVLMVMDSERWHPYVNHTLASLKHFGYDFETMSALDGWIKGEAIDHIKNLSDVNFNLDKLSLPQQGCFASHVAAWRQSQHWQRPIISLESDTIAVRAWDVEQSVYAQYDLLLVHTHDKVQQRCNQTGSAYVREGRQYWWGAGAVLFTGRRQPVVEEMLRRRIDKPLDHWMNEMWEGGHLRIGSLCPTFFRQTQDHDSQIPGPKDWLYMEKTGIRSQVREYD